jgi:uncharacterized protein (DUF2252 family)
MSELSDELIAFNRNRLPEMVKLKYEAMTDNVFRFFRGTCHLFYKRLSEVKKLPSSPLTWICGDLHLENFGSYKGNNKLVYFDLNDFDEAVLAPALWEVLRLITSIFIAFDTLDIDQEQAQSIAAVFINTYAATLCRGKALSIEPRTSKGIVSQFLKRAEKSTYKDILEKRTENKGHKVVLSLKHERHFKLKKELKSQLEEHITQWIKKSDDGPYNYKVKDAVFRLAGTGSIGLKRYLILLKSTNIKERYLLVDMKQSFESSLAPYLKHQQPAWENEAVRIITIQQRMQNVYPSLLSTTQFRGDDYVIQELQPVKDTLEFKLIKDQYRDIYQVVDDMAVLTASAQLRSGGMNGSAIIDELKEFGAGLADWRQPLLDDALRYAGQIKSDYKQFVEDYRNKVFEEQLLMDSVAELGATAVRQFL